MEGIGTNDYGAALAMTIQAYLDNRGEGVLVSLDVKVHLVVFGGPDS